MSINCAGVHEQCRIRAAPSCVGLLRSLSGLRRSVDFAVLCSGCSSVLRVVLGGLGASDIL